MREDRENVHERIVGRTLDRATSTVRMKDVLTFVAMRLVGTIGVFWVKPLSGKSKTPNYKTKRDKLSYVETNQTKD